MHGSINRRLALTLALAVACGTTARGQQYWAPQPQAYVPADGSAVRQASAMDMDMEMAADAKKAEDPNKALAADVADLKKQLKDIKDKEAAAKAAADLVPSVKVSGRVQWDTDTFGQNDNSLATAGDALTGSEFRRVYLAASGSMFKVFDYKAEVDLVPAHVSWKDVYIEAHDLPVAQNILIGHFYVPFGLETENGDLNLTFIERSVLDSLGGIGSRHAGIRMSGRSFEDRAWWGIGVYATQKNEAPPTFPVSGFDDNAGTSIYGRTAFLPWYDEATNGRGLWHVGVSGEYGKIPTIRTAGTTRFSLSDKPEADLAPVVVTTGDLPDADAVSALNTETALVYGPLSIQAEYEWIHAHRTTTASPTFDGGYVYCSYFLTGENRVYDKTRGVFGRVSPNENFFRVRDEDCCIQTGMGAWEVGYRCSYLNLNDSGIQGGRLVDHTIGLNWYQTPYCKMMFDLVHSDVTDIKKGGVLNTGISSMNAFLTRVQFDF